MGPAQTKTMKTKKTNQQHGFTLIELLVVIAIIAILASVSVPALQTALERGRMTKEMKQAQGVAQALRVWAADEDGDYPAGQDANEALAQLFPDIGKESVFFVRGSAWHGAKGSTFAKGPDEQYGDEEEGSGGQPLEPGENHWAFNVKATTTSNSSLPLLADGFSSQVGTYAGSKDELGGVWKGRRAIIIQCDGSGEIVKLNDQFKWVNEQAGNKDQFRREGVEMLNPAPPSG